MDNKGNNNQNNNNNRNGMTLLIFILAALVVLFIASMISSGITKMTNQKITYTQFKELVEEDRVEKVEFKSGLIHITPKTKEGQIALITYYAVQLDDEGLLPLLDKHGVDYEGIQASATTNFIYNILSFVIPIAICWILLAFVMRRMGGGGGVMGVGKSNAKVYVEKQTGVTFKDVAGQDEAKESLQEVVDFLHNPKKYTDIGAKLPKGALLVGPPGTGKTLLAKAVAGEAKVPFFSLAGSDFVEMFVGVGASRVRDLFKEAQKHAPCIVFIDEIDAIGKSRDTRYGGNDEREQTLNQLLAEMDGFDTSKGVLILAATNRPEVLDKALLRPGRFDRRIIVDKPDLKGRKETLKVHSKNVLMDDSVDLDAIALATSGAVGSDLANMINEAAINAVKSGRKYVNQSDLFESVEVVIAGKEKKDRIMGPKEKKLVAYHEVGHALVTALQKDAEPVQKITIIPRTKGALGYTMQVPEEEKFLMTKNELVAHLVTYMGGRAAEEIVFDSVTTGASNDIEQATKIARAMVTQYGMSEKFGLMGLVTVENQYLDGRASLNCGEETAAQIDKEVMAILQESYAQAKELLLENRSVLDEIAEYLYEHETITGKEFMDIFRRLKGLPPEAEKKEQEKESHINFKEADPQPVVRETPKQERKVSLEPIPGSAVSAQGKTEDTAVILNKAEAAEALEPEEDFIVNTLEIEPEELMQGDDAQEFEPAEEEIQGGKEKERPIIKERPFLEGIQSEAAQIKQTSPEQGRMPSSITTKQLQEVEANQHQEAEAKQPQAAEAKRSQAPEAKRPQAAETRQLQVIEIKPSQAMEAKRSKAVKGNPPREAKEVRRSETAAASKQPAKEEKQHPVEKTAQPVKEQKVRRPVAGQQLSAELSSELGAEKKQKAKAPVKQPLVSKEILLAEDGKPLSALEMLKKMNEQSAEDKGQS